MTTIERIPITDREQWLGLRKHDVTASVVAGLFTDVHPYMTPLKLYWMHQGLEFSNEETSMMRRGRLMEPAVALAVNDMRPDWTLTKNTHYFRDPDKRLGATPDYLIEGDPRGPGILQIKTCLPSVFERDWNSGARTPLWIELQTLTEMMLTDASFGVVACMHMSFDLDCTIRDVPRNAAAERRIVATVEQFWKDVAAGHEPDPDYNKDAELIKLIAPREITGKHVDLSGDNELPVLLAQREEIMDKIAAFESRKEEIEARVRFRLKDAEAAIGLPDWSISWKTYIRPEKVIEAKSIRTLRIHHRNKAA